MTHEVEVSQVSETALSERDDPEIRVSQVAELTLDQLADNVVVRASQVVAGVLLQDPSLEVRVSQVALVILLKGNPRVRVTYVSPNYPNEEVV